MSTVLEIDSLLESPLADLHAIAGELELDGYRTLRKSDLTIAILASRGADPSEIRPEVEAKYRELNALKAERERELAEQEERELAEREAAREAARAGGRQSETTAGGSGRSQNRRGRRGGRGRSRGGAQGGREGAAPRDDAKHKDARAGAQKESAKQDSAKQDQERRQEPATPLAGVFEPGSGGGGRLRTDLARRVRGDADVPRGEVRKWNLRRGDIVAAQVRRSKRGRTDYVVSAIDDVNGQDQQARRQKSEDFDHLAAAAAVGGYAKKLFKHAPVGPGSRLVVTGPTRAAASEMLKKLAAEIAAAGVVTTLVLVAARPEQSESVSGVELLLGDATKPPEDVLPALELVLERDKRLAEGGRNAALLVDGLDLLPAERATQIFNSARRLTDRGALTVAAACGSGSQLEALASSIGVVAGGRRLKIDKKASWTAL